MNEYPPECPLFEVTIDNGNFVPRGGIVEGVEICQNGYGEYHAGRIGARIVDESAAINLPRRCPIQGYAGIMFRLDDVKPLTPAAEEMLAIARARS